MVTNYDYFFFMQGAEVIMYHKKVSVHLKLCMARSSKSRNSFNNSQLSIRVCN